MLSHGCHCQNRIERKVIDVRLIDADAFVQFLKDVVKRQEYENLKIDGLLTVADVIEAIISDLDGTGLDGFKNAPTIEPELSETCTDCKEYDQERHCCPRWNRVIRETVKDLEAAHAWHECFPDDPNSFPDDDRNVLVSFSNFDLPIIGQWRVEDDGSGCWYLEDTDETFLSEGLFVDGWWELPKKPERN